MSPETPSARRLPVDMLARAAGRDKSVEDLLAGALRRHPKLSRPERALLLELVQGVKRWEIRLDYVLSRLSNLPLKKLHPLVLVILKVAAYQLLFLTRVPEQRIPSLAPRPLELGPVMQRLDGVERAVARFSSPDLGPVESRLVAIMDRLGAFGPGGEGQAGPDFGLVYGRMDGLERQLEALRGLLERAVERPTPTVVLAGSRNLLRRPVYGPPDDLKRIRGIGTALEKLLHRLGVYYFWQVAEWDHNDVKFVDGHLEIFKGRIDRDQWVESVRPSRRRRGRSRLAGWSAAAPGPGRSHSAR